MNHGEIEEVFVSHFNSILNAPISGCAEISNLSHAAVTGKLNDSEKSSLCRPVSLEEVESTAKHFSPLKSPGPNGCNAHFFKICWSNIRKDIFEAIKNFFIRGKLLSQVKHTFITLVPKSDHPSRPGDYRLISLTNELHKIISRIIVARMNPIISKPINPCQSAFIPGEVDFGQYPSCL